MKKTILLILLVITLSACVSNVHDNEKKPYLSNENAQRPTISKNNSSADGTFSDYFTPVNKLVINNRAYTGGNYYNLMGWQNYIYEKYKIELYVNYSNPSNEGITYLNFIKGLTYVNNIRLLDYAKEETSYDLTPYYSKYEWDYYIESQYIEALTTSSGIYAIPVSSGKYIVPRYYNKEYIEKLNMPVPSTSNELYEFLKGVKELNADDEKFIPMCILNRALTKSTSDIFRAFGVYVDSELNTSVTYNPNTNSFEDAVFSKDIDSPILFLRQLQQENLLSIQGRSRAFVASKNGEAINLFDNNLYSLNKNFATEYYYVYDSISNGFTYHVNAQPNYEVINGYWLADTNNDNVCEVRSDMAFYLFPKTIHNINGVIDLFNDVFTNNKYYYDLKYGVEDIDYTRSNDSVIINEPKIGAFIDLKQINNIYDTSSNYVPKSVEIIKNMSIDRYYEKNVFNMSIFYLRGSDADSLNYSNNTQLEMLFSNKVGFVDAIDEYKNNFNKSDMSTIIDKLNENLGLVSQYDYN